MLLPGVGRAGGLSVGLLGVRAEGGPSAVDGQDGAVDETGLIGQQVADRVGPQALNNPQGFHF